MSKKHDKDFLMSRAYATFVANEYAKRIEKAIEYIKEHNVIATNKSYIPKEYEYCCSVDLLNILKGKENE